MLLLRQQVPGLLLVALRAQTRERRSSRIDSGSLHAGIDLHQKLAALDNVARLHMKSKDLARDLRPHVHVVPRLQHAERRDAGLYEAACHRHGFDIRGFAVPPQQARASSRSHEYKHCGNDNDRMAAPGALTHIAQAGSPQAARL